MIQIAIAADGYNQVIKLALEALMQGDRMIYKKQTGDLSNGYRPRKTYGRVRSWSYKYRVADKGIFLPH